VSQVVITVIKREGAQAFLSEIDVSHTSQQKIDIENQIKRKITKKTKVQVATAEVEVE